MSHDDRVALVVVTWNRRALLAEALRAVEAQTTPPSRVIVVDNASDDGTATLLASQFPHVEVVSATTNIGGAGGFALGIDEALSPAGSGARCNAIWLMDDDTIPEPDALAELVGCRSRHPEGPPALVASRVMWVDGRDHPMNTPRLKPAVRARERSGAASAGGVPIRSASFVSVLVDADAVSQCGLPIADYFLWNDDFEFTTRLLRGRRGLFCPASVVVHKTKTFGSTDADPGERFFYEVRNKVWLFTRSFGLNPVEKVLYAGSTLRRWAHTLARSTDRGVLLRGLGHGLVAGLKSGPRATAEVLAQARDGATP